MMAGQNEITSTDPNNLLYQQQHTVTQPLQNPAGLDFFCHQPGIPGQETCNQYFQTCTAGGCNANQTYLAANAPLNVPFHNQNLFMPANSPIQQQQQQLPQSTIDQIRACVNGVQPIFVLPRNCQQTLPHASTPQSGVPHNVPSMTYPTTSSTYPTVPVAYSSPPFIPYPVPVPIYESCYGQSDIRKTCCCKDVGPRCHLDINRKLFQPACGRTSEQETHRCCDTTDDAICARRDCPASINLQALVSQFLSIQGVIPCVATRLVLRKIPASNIDLTDEEIVERARKTVNTLTKDQLIVETRNAQQITTLINLHMTSTPPPNVIPVLTAVQLKINTLKVHIETRLNKKLMESQGVGTDAISALDPMILSLKTDSELREFLIVLQQKENEERINVNFSPYHSQRAVAETRLASIQCKIQQVEAEMGKRFKHEAGRASLTARTIQGFVDTRGSLGFDCCNVTANSYQSPDPFVIKICSPRRLHLQPHVGSPETTYATVSNERKTTQTTRDDKRTDDTEIPSKDSDGRSSLKCENSNECSCESSSSGESISESKKKLRLEIDKGDLVNPKIGDSSVVRDKSSGMDTKNVTEGSSGTSLGIDSSVIDEKSKKSVKILEYCLIQRQVENISSDVATVNSGFSKPLVFQPLMNRRNNNKLIERKWNLQNILDICKSPFVERFPGFSLNDNNLISELFSVVPVDTIIDKLSKYHSILHVSNCQCLINLNNQNSNFLLVSRVANFSGILSNCCGVLQTLLQRTRINRSNDTKLITKKFSICKISKGENCNIRTIKHKIFEDRENREKNNVIIYDKSKNEHFNSKPPYKTRKSLLIRSKRKNTLPKYSRPFSIIKRCSENKKKMYIATGMN